MSELYIEFFLRFFVILALMISSLLLIAIFLKMRKRKYLIELLVLGLLIFCLFWGIYEFSEIIFVSALLMSESIGNELIAKTFALMGAIMIFSISIVKKRLRRL